MRLHTSSSLGFVAFVLAQLFAPGASAQCLSWREGFTQNGLSVPGSNDSAFARASIVFDDGSGPALYVGGQFDVAGGVPASSIAKWDGTSWSPLGSGVANPGATLVVIALAVFDDGHGPALYAAGEFTVAGGIPANRIAKWNGTGWSALADGLNGDVFALAVFDDGTGAKLYAGGKFDHAGTLPVSNLARWDGSSWSALSGTIDDTVYSFATFDDGTGPALYVGGRFHSAGGVTTSPSLVRWDGTTWAGVGGGTNHFVYGLATYDDGLGTALYAGGDFSTAGGQSAVGIAKWDGSSWQALGDGIGTVGSQSAVFGLLAFDDGTGPALYAGGSFSLARGGPGDGVARWNGSSWSELGLGVLNAQGAGRSFALAGLETPSGPVLYVGGDFERAGPQRAYDVAGWTSGSWSALEDDGDGVTGDVEAFAVGDLGDGPALYAAGTFDHAGVLPVQRIARWDGTAWSALDPGLVADDIHALAIYDDGTGPALYVAGHQLVLNGNATGHIVRWNGASWSTLQSGVTGQGGFTEISGLVVFDDGTGSALYACGSFNQASGPIAYSLARWNGSVWGPVGTGFEFSDGGVRTMAVHDDGTGPALFVGGAFDHAGALPANHVAKWNGLAWSAVGAGFASPSSVLALASCEVGGAHRLYAGGQLATTGGVSVSNIASWDGTAWSPLDTGLCSTVETMHAYDEGGGPALYVGGSFTCAGQVPARFLAKWDGAAWSAVGGGLDGIVYALATFASSPGAPPSLYAGGGFSSAGETASRSIAEWRGCATSPGIPFCFGDGSGHACPCANSGVAGHGCENSIGTGGAVLAASGTTAPDTIVLSSSGELPLALTVFIQGTSTVGPFLYGDGLRCTGGALKRLYSKNASGGVASAPQGTEPSITARSAALGDPLYPGFTRRYQTYYRDPNPAFCPSPTGSTFNASNAVSITW